MKILIHSDDPRAHTGYGTQARRMAQIFRKLGHETIFSAQHSMDVTAVVTDIDGFAHKIYGMGKGQFINMQALTEIYQLERFDHIITMADWQMVEKMIEAPPEIFCRWICYCAADAEMLTTRWDYLIQEIPYMVFFTPKFAESVVKHRRLGYVNYVPLTVDHEVFKPLPDRETLRRETKERMGWQANCATVLTVARNQWRKNYPEIIVAAAQLEKFYPGLYRFVFHCKPQEDFGWDLPKLLDHHGAQKLAAISDQDVPDSSLNHIYNTADVFLLPSQGEGFGVPIVEAAMAGIPVVTTGATAGLDVAKMVGWKHLCLRYSTYWQNGPTIPRPYVRGADIFDGIVTYSQQSIRNEGQCMRSREMAIDEFSPQIAEKKWLEVLTQAKGILDMRLGNSGPYLGGKMYVEYEFPTV